MKADQSHLTSALAWTTLAMAPPGADFEGGAELIHVLLVIAAILFVLWLLFHAASALINLIWLAIIVLVVIWLIGLVRGRSTTS
jgi:hypothetical protein